jgi:hypothetical protein
MNVSTAGLGAGATEAVLVVTPMEVVKIRLQAQQHSLADPMEAPRYRNAGHAVYSIIREEGVATLYRGVSLTVLRQATNQGANFTAYQEIKKFAHKMQPELSELPSYQHMIIGLISGAMGPFSNAPIDTIKTRTLFILIANHNSFRSCLCFVRFAEGDCHPWPFSFPADHGNCLRYVETGGFSVFLQGHHTSSAPSCTRTGYCIRRLRTSETCH